MLEAQAALTAPSGQPKDTDFDVTRTFSLLLVTLVLPMYLAVSLVAFSLAATY